MNKIIKMTGICIFSIAFYGCGTDTTKESQATERIVNPVLPGDRPDPSVIKIGDTYWATATSNDNAWAGLGQGHYDNIL